MTSVYVMFKVYFAFFFVVALSFFFFFKKSDETFSATDYFSHTRKAELSFKVEYFAFSVNNLLAFFLCEIQVRTWIRLTNVDCDFFISERRVSRLIIRVRNKRRRKQNSEKDELRSASAPLINLSHFNSTMFVNIWWSLNGIQKGHKLQANLGAIG